jgi:3-oxoacyl-[acyl-carrier-protein] synthase-3
MHLIGIRGFEARLAENSIPVDRVVNDPSQFKDIQNVWIAPDIQDLILVTAQNALKTSGIEPTDIDAFYWVSALSTNHERRSETPGNPSLSRFCYPASWLHAELGFRQTPVTGIAQQGCAGLFSAIRLAHNQLASETDLRHILIVAGDALDPSADRQIFFNLISDAACAVIVSKGIVSYRILGTHQITKGEFWDVNSKPSEIAASYFPSATRVVHNLLSRLNLQVSDIDWVISTGVRPDSWHILLRLWKIPVERCYFPKHSFGHTIQADSFLILREAENAGAIHPGQRILLFTFGFGSTWSALLLEVTK